MSFKKRENNNTATVRQRTKSQTGSIYTGKRFNNSSWEDDSN
jgi:hypothetical protein